MNHYVIRDGDIQLCSYCWDKPVKYKDWCCRLHYFLERAHRVHGNTYDYSKFKYAGAVKNGTIICKKHGKFQQSPNSHYRGNGCQQCGRERTIQGSKKGRDYFVELSKRVHNEFYDYSKFEYNGYEIPGIIICPNHGEFMQPMVSHYRGHGCPQCKKLSIRHSLSLGKPLFVKKAHFVHKNKYDYSKVVYKNVSSKGIIICPDHGEFSQVIHDHLAGFGCPKCNSVYSKQSIRWLQWIAEKDNINIQHAENGGEYCIPGTRIKLDGYCEETDTAYEYYGDFWHGNPEKYPSDKINKRTGETMGELYKKTMEREKLVLQHVSNIVTIWESDWKHKF